MKLIFLAAGSLVSSDVRRVVVFPQHHDDPVVVAVFVLYRLPSRMLVRGVCVFLFVLFFISLFLFSFSRLVVCVRTFFCADLRHFLVRHD